MKKELTEKEKFNKWMRKKVKSVYYFDNQKMCNAYERILEKK
jgi:hypothetical protein